MRESKGEKKINNKRRREMLVVTKDSVCFISGMTRKELGGNPLHLRWGRIDPTNGSTSYNDGELLQLEVGKPLLIRFFDHGIKRNLVTSTVEKIIGG